MTARRNSRYETLLFDHKSTQRTDYQFLPITKSTQTVYKSKPRKTSPRYPGLKNQHTFHIYDGPIPFDLLHKPKDIVRTSPHDCQEKFQVKTVDEGLFNAQKTRPRLYIAPGVGMDDVEDPSDHELIVKDFYVTSYACANEQVAAVASKKTANRAPLTAHLADARPIRLPSYQPPVVPEEWRMETLTWESRQLRSWVDANCAFWLTRKTEPKATESVHQSSNAEEASLDLTTHE